MKVVGRIAANWSRLQTGSSHHVTIIPAYTNSPADCWSQRRGCLSLIYPFEHRLATNHFHQKLWCKIIHDTSPSLDYNQTRLEVTETRTIHYGMTQWVVNNSANSIAALLEEVHCLKSNLAYTSTPTVYCIARHSVLLPGCKWLDMDLGAHNDIDQYSGEVPSPSSHSIAGLLLYHQCIHQLGSSTGSPAHSVYCITRHGFSFVSLLYTWQLCMYLLVSSMQKTVYYAIHTCMWGRQLIVLKRYVVMMTNIMYCTCIQMGKAGITR